MEDKTHKAPLTWEENVRRWNVSRRRFLRIAAAGAAVAATSTLLPPALRQNSLSADGDEVEQPKQVRKWAMVFDLRKCDGCQSAGMAPQCTTACIEGHFVPEPMEWIDVYEHDLPGGGTQFLPTPCMQCQNPPCVNVCPVGATWSTPEGVVLIDQDRCIGCRMCMAACPYERRFFVWADPPIPPEAFFVEYSPEHQVPLRRGTVAKCDFCPEMARAGRLPFCAQACPNGAIYYGDFEEDVATNGEEVVALSRFLSDNQAYNYKADLGTKPRVFYIAGHGEAVGRDAFTKGRLSTEWPWERIAEGTKRWKRSGQ